MRVLFLITILLLTINGAIVDCAAGMNVYNGYYGYIGGILHKFYYVFSGVLVTLFFLSKPKHL